MTLVIPMTTAIIIILFNNSLFSFCYHQTSSQDLGADVKF